MIPGREPVLQAIVLAISVSTGGCAVGPNFAPPGAPDVSGYTAGRLAMTDAAAVSGGLSQRFASGKDVSGVWWRTLRSKQIDASVKEAIDNHPNPRRLRPRCVRRARSPPLTLALCFRR